MNVKKYLAFALCCFSFVALEAQEGKADLFYLEGHRQMTLGNQSDAFEMFRHSLDVDPHYAPAMAQLSTYWSFFRNDSLATEYMESAVREDPSNFWFQEQLVDLYVNSGKIDEAISVLEKLSEQYPDKTDVMFMLESLYKQKQDFEGVVEILDRLELKEGKSEQLSMEKFRTYVQMQDKAKAFKEMSELADEYPNDLRYKVLVGDLYLDDDNQEAALKAYEEVEKLDPTNIYYMASMLNYYSKTNQDSLYQAMIEKVCTNPQLDEDTRLRFLNSLVYQNLQNEQDTTKLLNIFDKVLLMPQRDAQIAELCARYMVTLKLNPERVKPVLNQMLLLDPESDMARSQLLTYAIESDDTLEVVKVCKPAVDYSTEDPVFYYYLGIAYFQLDSAQKAIDTFQKGFTHIDNNSNLQLITNMYALMGDSYHKLGNQPKAYEAYDSCLLYRPDEALVLNNYAYYLSLEGKQLDKAAEMSLRSLQKEPENYTYIDTYAWILFRQKKYKDAKEWIDKAIELMGDSISEGDANIIEHAGDIYSKNKLTDKAMKFWQQSIELGNHTPLIDKKIKKKKYVEY